MEDTEFTPAVFNGQKVESGRFAGSLRRHLMREHLGILGEANGDEVVEDPVSDSFYKDVWIKRAAINTKVRAKHPFCQNLEIRILDFSMSFLIRILNSTCYGNFRFSKMSF